MLIEEMKTVERLKKRIEEERSKYKEAHDRMLAAAKKIEYKANELKSKAASKKRELADQIKYKDELLREKAYNTLSDDKVQDELRTLSIEMDVLKRQESALSEGQRKTIVVACKKEIEELKRAYRDTALRQNLLYLMYNKYFKAINDIVNPLNKILKDEAAVNSTYMFFYNAAINVHLVGVDYLKSVAEYVFDQDIKVPGTNDDSYNTAYDLWSDYYSNNAYGEVLPEAQRIVDRL